MREVSPVISQNRNARGHGDRCRPGPEVHDAQGNTGRLGFSSGLRAGWDCFLQPHPRTASTASSSISGKAAADWLGSVLTELLLTRSGFRGGQCFIPAERLRRSVTIRRQLDQTLRTKDSKTETWSLAPTLRLGNDGSSARWDSSPWLAAQLCPQGLSRRIPAKSTSLHLLRTGRRGRDSQTSSRLLRLASR